MKNTSWREISTIFLPQKRVFPALRAIRFFHFVHRVFSLERRVVLIDRSIDRFVSEKEEVKEDEWWGRMKGNEKRKCFKAGTEITHTSINRRD